MRIAKFNYTPTMRREANQIRNNRFDEIEKSQGVLGTLQFFAGSLFFGNDLEIEGDIFAALILKVELLE